MLNFLKNLLSPRDFSSRDDVTCNSRPERDAISNRAEDAEWLASELLKMHVRANGLHKISREAVRNAMTYAHAMGLARRSYERELREEAAREALKSVQFTPAAEADLPLEEAVDYE